MARLRRHPQALALLLTLVLVGQGSVRAQNAAPSPVPAISLSLARALDMAEPRSEPVELAKVALTRNEGDFVRAKSGQRPQLSATATYDRSLANEFQGVFDNLNLGGGSGSGGGSGGGEGDTAAADFSKLPFGRANTWRATLALSQNVYSGGRVGAQTALASTGRRSAELAINSARALMLFDVTQAYYDAALSGRLVAIAEATLDQADLTLRQVQAGFDAGTQPEFEVLRARVNRDNQVPQIIRQRVDRDLAHLRLKRLLDLPAESELQLTEPLDDEQLVPPAPFAERVSAVERLLPAGGAVPLTVQTGGLLPDRNVVAEAETVVRLRENSLQAVRAERMPSVNLTSTYSRIAYPTGFVPAFDRTNWAIGANMSVPILTGGRQKGDEMVARADVEQARVQLRQVQELAALDTRAAWAALLASRAAWEATAGTVQQATRAYQIAEVRYSAGLSTQLELSDARLLLQQAEANRAQAARDLQMTRARAALLPNLPLGAGTTAATVAAAGGGQPTVPAPAQPPSQQVGIRTVQGAATPSGPVTAGAR
jgi:outer membrane protein